MCFRVPMRMQPMLDGGRRMDQKQLARSMTAMQGVDPGECKERCAGRQERRRAPICKSVGRRNLGGGRGQLAFRVCMLMMSAAFVGLLLLINTSAFGRPGWRATSPAESKASSIACTRGQREDFCGGVRASARRSPPGAEESQMCGGMGTYPTGPRPLAATDRDTGSGRIGDKEVSDDW